MRERQSLMYAKLKPLSPSKSVGVGRGEEKKTEERALTQQRRVAQRAGVAEETRASIEAFENKLKATPSSGFQGAGQALPPQHTTATVPQTNATVSDRLRVKEVWK